VNLAESWPEFRGDTLTLHLDIALKPEVRTTQRVFVRAIDGNGVASQFSEFDSWKPAAGQVQEYPWSFPPNPPTLSVESRKLPGVEKYGLTVRASDVNGVEDIDAVDVIVNNIPDRRHSCYFRYDRNTKAVSLMNNGGTAFTGPLEPGSPKQLSNSYCAITVPDSPVVKGPYDVYLSFEVVLSKKMLEKRTIYLAVVDREGLRQDWRAYALLPAAAAPGL
jgi:hypothetical protein